MYCPKCGESNGEDTKFCRACGENLKVVAQAMTGRLPVTLASKLDAYIERKNERLRRDGIGSAVFGVCFILLSAYELSKGSPFFGTTGIMLLFAFFMLLVSAWDMMAYKRSLDPRAKSANPLSIKDHGTKELPPQRTAPGAMPPSVTESTTRHLKTPVERTKERR
jgi:hypothetical protein